MEVAEYRPYNGEVLHIWDHKCIIYYNNIRFELSFEAQPPHGDFIYSMRIYHGSKEQEFHYWLYGRNVMFYKNYILMEVKEAGNEYRGLLHTGILNIVNNTVTVIDDWFCNFSIGADIIKLSNRHTNKELIIKDFSDFDWVSC
ncbi:hypothetical protein AN1V17_50740 [Vallitalea sediminicola]